MTRPVYDEGRVHRAAEQCSTCIFRPGNPMRLARGRVAGMVQETRDEPGATITCHHTIHGEGPQEAICRGWWERYAGRDPILRLAEALGIVTDTPVS